MKFTIEVTRIERIEFEAKDYAEAEKTTADVRRIENVNGKNNPLLHKLDVDLLGPTKRVLEDDKHRAECKGCCPDCGDHCPEFGGTSCGGGPR